MFLIKISLIVTLLFVFFQDSKDRQVYWFLYPVSGILFFILQNKINGLSLSITHSIVNFLFVLIILLCALCYNLFKLKLDFLKEVLGVGDVLFFVFICFAFSPISFVVLFVFSLLFSLLLHFIVVKENNDTVPLAGYMSLFFALVIFFSFFINVSFLFAY